MTTYQIRDWRGTYENNRSRAYKNCKFVCVPNKQHGEGMIRILTEPDGVALYGIWCLILGAASMHSARDGWLTSDGTESGHPWSASYLALRWRTDEEKVARLLSILSSDSVGWLLVQETGSEVQESRSEVQETGSAVQGIEQEPELEPELELEEEGRATPAKPEPLPALSVPQLKISNVLCCEPFLLSPAKCTELAIRYTGAKYAALDVVASLDNCAEWLADNPERKSRTPRGMVQRINRWIKGDLDRGPAPKGGRPAYRDKTLPGTAPKSNAHDTYNDPKTGIWRSHAITAIKNAGLNWEQYEDEELRDMGKGVTPYPEGVS